MKNSPLNFKGNFSIRKFKTGVASVLLSTSLLALSHQASVSAQEVDDNLQVLDGTGSLTEPNFDSAETSEETTNQVEEKPEVSNENQTQKESDMTQGQSGCDVSEGDKVCTIDRSKVEVTNDVEMNSKIVFDDKTFNHVDKVKNEDNAAHDHTNPDYAKFYGPGDLEFNYWKDSDKNRPTEIYRVNFGTEHELLDGILSVTLPYTDVQLKDLYEQGLLKFTNASSWLVNRLYRNESNYDRIIEDIPEVSFDNNKILFNLGKLAPRTAFSVQIHRIFESIEAFDSLSAKKGTEASTQVTGKYNFTNIDLPTPTEKTTWENYEGDLRALGFDPETTKTGDMLEYIEDVTRPGYDGSKNGYVSKKKTTYRILGVIPVVDQKGEIVLDDNKQPMYCYNIERTVEFLKDFTMQAESIIDTKLNDYSNNGYLEKVFNDNNHGHPKLDANEDGIPDNIGLYGPGNIEVQHWQDGPNEATKKQTWRFVFANDYSVANGKLTLTLPYEITKDAISDATTWLTDRYYPAVGGAKYSNVNTLLKINILDRISVEGNKVVLDLSDLILPSRTAFALQIAKVFEKPQDFSKELKKAQMKFEGQWYFNNVELPHEEAIVKNECPECKIEIPEKPKPEKPKPEEPKPEQPIPGIPTPEKPEPQEPKPEEPKPEEPIVIEQPVAEASVLPATGESNQYVVWGGAALSILVGLGLASYRDGKKKENN